MKKNDIKIGHKVEVEWAYCVSKPLGIQLGTLTFEYLGDLEWKKTFTSVLGEIVDAPFALKVTQPSFNQGEDHAKRIKAGKAHSSEELIKMREERKAQSEKADKAEKPKAEKQEKPKKEKPKAEKPTKPSTLPDSGPKP